MTYNLHCFTRHTAPCSKLVHLIPAMNSSIGYPVHLAVLFTLDLQPGASNLPDFPVVKSKGLGIRLIPHL